MAWLEGLADVIDRSSRCIPLYRVSVQARIGGTQPVCWMEVAWPGSIPRRRRVWSSDVLGHLL